MFLTFKRTAAVGALALVPAIVLTACSSSSNSSNGPPSTGSTGPALTKTPITLMTATSTTGPITFPEIPVAAKAAALAINNAGGVKGHPIKIVTCDTKFTPDGSAACARQAVTDKVTAVVGTVDPNGDTYLPILAKAGIPEVANFPNSNSDTTSPFSFPIGATALQAVAAGVILKSAGAKSVQYLGPNVPTYVGLTKLLAQLLPTVGVPFKGSTLFPVAATDYTQYAAQAYGSGAGGVHVTLTSSAGTAALVNAVNSGGYSFTKTPTSLFGSTFLPSLLSGPLKNKLDGVYVINLGQTPTDTSLPGIKTFHNEIAAAGTPTEFDDSSLEAWVGVHVIAQVLAKATGEVTSPATLISAMKAAGPINYPGWTPFDWSKPALPQPLAKSFPRYFNATVWVSKIIDNKAVSDVSAPVPFSGPVKLLH